MAQIAYILLCHKEPDAILRQAERLTTSGDTVTIHFDRNASAAAYQKLRQALAGNASVAFTSRRIRCGWGQWSLVAATLEALDTAQRAFPRATHFYMLSGDCMPIKSAEYMHDFLDAEDADYIEYHDFFESNWIKTGLKEERLIYRHFFNERSQPRRFYGAMALQQRLGITRNPPHDLRMCIGSQWWCLRRTTVERVLDFIRDRRDVTRFFATTWIPDETFFQTLVPHLVARSEIRNRTPTFLLFTDYGMPATFYNDHYEMLLGQSALFARKISPEADRLKEALGALYASRGTRFTLSNEGEGLFRFLTGRGRVGRRFAPRFWDPDAPSDRDRELLIVVCKKWHVAKRLLTAVRQHSNVPAVEYIFNEEAAGLPDLGGIQSTVPKRMRNPRALVQMLLEHFETDRLILCMDPMNFDLIADFAANRMQTRVLQIDCRFSDAYLIGHAKRVGLAGEQTAPATLARLLPTIRNDISYERDRLRDAKLALCSRFDERADVARNAQALAQFLSLPLQQAAEIAGDRTLFAD